MHIQLKFVETMKRYTVAKIEQKNYIKTINVYPAEHPAHKTEHKNIYITYERIIELQPIALENGYLFVW